MRTTAVRQRWVHTSETATPYTKGEGASLMIADFVFADYGWLRSADGSKEARNIFKAGKACDGYYTNEDIVQQANRAIDILQTDYPNERPYFRV